MGNDRAAGDNLASGAAFARGDRRGRGGGARGARGVRAVSAGALAGAAALGAIDYTARKRQKPNEIPAIWSRIAASAALAAPAGWLADKLGAGPITVGTGAGTVAGALGLRPQKVAARPGRRRRRGRRLPRSRPGRARCAGRRYDGPRLPHACRLRSSATSR